MSPGSKPSPQTAHSAPRHPSTRHGVPATCSQPRAGPSRPRWASFHALPARARNAAQLARHQDPDHDAQEWPDRELPTDPIGRPQLVPDPNRSSRSRRSTRPMPRPRRSACGLMPAPAPRRTRPTAPPTSSSTSPSRYGPTSPADAPLRLPRSPCLLPGQGTSKRSQHQLELEIENMGAHLNAYTSVRPGRAPPASAGR